MTRRALLRGAVGGALAAAGAAAASPAARPLWDAIARRVADEGPDGVIPGAPPGDERVEVRHSPARGRAVHFYTAVPAGHGDGAGLPVCLVLHGARSRPAQFPAFGFGRFLSDAVARGAEPFVLAGASGGRLRWEPGDRDDPRRMVLADVPRWCAERGFDTSRIAVWGYSMGGYGALALAQAHPGWLRAVAAFSPALSGGDSVFRNAARLDGTPIGLWCGRQDRFYRSVRQLERVLPEPLAAGGFAPGGHTRGYWNRVTPAAFDFLAAALMPSG